MSIDIVIMSDVSDCMTLTKLGLSITRLMSPAKTKSQKQLQTRELSLSPYVVSGDPLTPEASFDLGNSYTKIESDNGMVVDVRSVYAQRTDAALDSDDIAYEDAIRQGNEWWVFGEKGLAYAQQSLAGGSTSL